jgi:hypothetical protein
MGAPEHHPQQPIAGPNPHGPYQWALPEPKAATSAANDDLPSPARPEIDCAGGDSVGTCSCSCVEVDQARMLVLRRHRWTVVETRRSAGVELEGGARAAAESYVVVPMGCVGERGQGDEVTGNRGADGAGAVD